MKSAYDLYRQAWQLVTTGQLKQLTRLVDPDFRLVVNGQEYKLDGTLEFMEAWRTGFSNFGRNRVEEDCVDDNLSMIAATHSMRLIHDGLFVTPAGALPASGRTIDLVSADLVVIKGDRILKWCITFDSAVLQALAGS